VGIESRYEDLIIMEVKDCFAIMPFSTSKSHTEEEWTQIFENFFKPAWNAFNIDCYRTKVPRGSITKDIIEKLYSASIVFADLTDSNPNVMYELGVRHTFKKPSVMVKAKGSEIPFDVNDYNVFEYEYTPKGVEDLKKHLSTVIEDIRRFPNKADNPVWDFRHTSDFLVDYYRNIETAHKLQAIVLELNSNCSLCDELLDGIENIDLTINPELIDESTREQLEIGARKFFPSIRSDAITHLRITRYIDFEVEDWKNLEQVDAFYRWCHYFSSNLEVMYFFDDDKQRISNIRGTIVKAMSTIGKRIAEIEIK